MAVNTRKRTESASRESGPIRFFRETADELRKVVWPTGPELYRYTVVVIVTVAALAIFIGVVDGAVSALVQKFIYSKLAGA